MADTPTKYPFLYTDGSPADVHEKLCRQAGDYAQVADRIVDVDSELLPLEAQIKDRELDMYLDYRHRKDNADKGDPEYKWTEQVIEALIREDRQLREWRRRLIELRIMKARLEVAARGLEIRERSLTQISANNRVEGSMRS